MPVPLCQPFAQQSERPFAVTAEHGIVDTCQERGAVVQGWRHRDVVVVEAAGHMVEVELIEDGVLPVACHRLQILLLVFAALPEQPAQVGALGQGVAVDGIVNVVASHLVAVIADGCHVDALAGLQPYLPVVPGHAGDDVVVSQLPALAHVRVLYPDVRVLSRERYLAN